MMRFVIISSLTNNQHMSWIAIETCLLVGEWHGTLQNYFGANCEMRSDFLFASMKRKLIRLTII